MQAFKFVSRSDMPSNFPLNFEGVLLIVGGGTVDLALLARLHKGGAQLVAADGGAQACAAAGLIPDAIIGDLDSITDRQAWASKTQFVHITEQETTDFEKCLYATTAKITIAIGMTGGRFDHTLAALDVVARYGDQRRLILIDEVDVALVANGAFSFAVKSGDRVSFHPLKPVQFTASTGLKYPLEGITLAPGARTGTSNVANADRISLRTTDAQSGPYLVIMDMEYLDGLVVASADA